MKSVYLTGASSVFGSRIVPSEEIDQAYGMPIGKLRNRAGILSVAQATDAENEGTLAIQSCRNLLQACNTEIAAVDWIVASSETYHAYPSLSAVLHAQLKCPENTAALDAGSGCMALLQGLAVAQSLLVSGQANNILVVTSDVHSRTLGPGRAAGEFGGLFGDGASAFLLTATAPKSGQFAFQLGEFFFGCAAQYAETISVTDTGDGKLQIQFDGEALSRAAVNRMQQILLELSQRSGIPINKVGAFATHQPNPRLVTLLAKQLGVPPATFPPIASVKGNLGCSMCGAALHAAFSQMVALPEPEQKPVFLTSLAPGLLYGGGWMVPAR